MKRYACNICDFKSYFQANVRMHHHSKHKGQELKVTYIDCAPCQQKVTHLRHKNPKNQKTKKKNLNPIKVGKHHQTLEVEKVLNDQVKKETMNANFVKWKGLKSLVENHDHDIKSEQYSICQPHQDIQEQ